MELVEIIARRISFRTLIGIGTALAAVAAVLTYLTVIGRGSILFGMVGGAILLMAFGVLAYVWFLMRLFYQAAYYLEWDDAQRFELLLLPTILYLMMQGLLFWAFMNRSPPSLIMAGATFMMYATLAAALLYAFGRKFSNNSRKLGEAEWRLLELLQGQFRFRIRKDSEVA